MGVLAGKWHHCGRCGFPNDLDNGCCSECGMEFEDTEEVKEMNKAELKKKLICPECESKVVEYRIKTDEWKCRRCGGRWSAGRKT